MRIPQTICKNTLIAYQLPESVYLRKEKIKFDNFDWDKNFKTLRECCIYAIAKKWKEYPYYNKIVVEADRQLLIEILPCDLPLELTVPRIEHDFYWERCYKFRWPNAPRPDRHVKQLHDYYGPALKRKSSDELSSMYATTESSIYEPAKQYSSSTFCGKYIQDPTQLSDLAMKTDGGRSYVFPTDDVWKTVTRNEKLASQFTMFSYYTGIEYQYNSYPTSYDSYSNFLKFKKVITKPISKPWKQCFLERYLQEELERMKPDQFNKEFIKDLTELCKEYVYTLKITSLLATTPGDENALQPGDHISLDFVIAGLPNLFEFSVCFCEANQRENFSWNKMKVSERDCKQLGVGLIETNVHILRILRSDINCAKLILFLRPLTRNQSLRVLDLSHCKIGDDGAVALAGALQDLPLMETLILVNNKIGAKGAEGLAYYLQQLNTNVGLVNLNLKLNHIGTEGGNYFGSALFNGAVPLKHLCLAACGLTSQCIGLTKALMFNTTLEKLDLSSNDLGYDFESVILIGIVDNTTIIHIDLRMCNISAETRNQVDEILKRNWIQRRGKIKNPPFTHEMPYRMF